MIDGSVGTRLGDWMGWEHLEGSGGQLEPENEAREIIQRHLLPNEALLGKVLPIVLERVRIRAKGLPSRYDQGISDSVQSARQACLQHR